MPTDSQLSTPVYPPGTVRALLATSHVTPQTRAALLARLEPPLDAAPRFFDGETFAVFAAVCARLVAPVENAVALSLAVQVDGRLAAGGGDGWRYAAMPPDGEAYRRGTQGVEALARTRFSASFHALEAAQQDAILRDAQRGNVTGEPWDTLPAARFFEDVLAEVAQYFYSDPLVQEEIGYVGMADAHGWHAITLDTREAREPLPVTNDNHGHENGGGA